MKKAYSYIRFSSAEQAKGRSQARQLEGCEKYSRDHNLNLILTVSSCRNVFQMLALIEAIPIIRAKPSARSQNRALFKSTADTTTKSISNPCILSVLSLSLRNVANCTVVASAKPMGR